MVDAIVHVWSPDQAVRFPLAVIEDDNIRSSLPDGFSGEFRMFAQVNIGCSDEGELYFTTFEVAPELTDDEG